MVQEKATFHSMVLRRYEIIVPVRIYEYSCVHNRITFVCRQDCFDSLLDYLILLESIRSREFEGRTREEIQRTWEWIFGLNLKVSSDASDEGHFIDDLGNVVDEGDKEGWRERLRRWKEAR